MYVQKHNKLVNGSPMLTLDCLPSPQQDPADRPNGRASGKAVAKALLSFIIFECVYLAGQHVERAESE